MPEWESKIDAMSYGPMTGGSGPIKNYQKWWINGEQEGKVQKWTKKGIGNDNKHMNICSTLSDTREIKATQITTTYLLAWPKFKRDWQYQWM